MSQRKPGLGGLIAEARRRRVFRTAGLYIVGAWVFLQVADLALESAELPESLLRYFALANLYAAVGEADEAFYWLNVAKEMKLPWYPWLITWYPGLSDIRDDPRMRELAEELNLSGALDRALGWLKA